MTMQNEPSGAGGTSAAPVGTVTPRIRGRLRSRLPGPIRTARGQLIVLAGYLMITVVVYAFTALTGGLAKLNLSTADIAASTIGNAAVAGICILATRMLISRSQAGYLLAVATGAFVAGSGLWAIYRVVNGQAGVAGDPAFFVFVYQGVFVVLGLAIVVNLLRVFGKARQAAAETDVTSGQGLRVPLRDMRILPGKAAAPPPAIETVEGTVDAGADLDPIAAGIADNTVAVRDTREPLLAVRGLKKHFPIYGGLLRRQIGTVFAVDGVDFDVFPGEIFSLVGESGCGKTTLGRTVLQLTPPTAGKVVFDGYELADVDPDDMRPLRRRMQIIFQDPFGSLNPRMPVSDIIGEGLLAQGVSDRKTRDKRVEDSLEIVGLRRDYTRRYPHEFSGGQRQRIGIARALALGPDLIVCDEPVSALDVSIQSQVLNLLLDLRRDFNLTYLFISHNLSVVQYFSDRVGVMYLGKLVEEGAVEQLYRDPRHPYTVALLSAIPNPDPRKRRKRLVLKGDVPSPAAPPSGCRFHTRCWLREKLGNPERCSTEEPLLRTIDEAGHRTACHFAEEVSEGAVASVVATQSVVETAVADPA
jgi:oligopeptide/dipeptide ABC transporter ATP-binding protein